MSNLQQAVEHLRRGEWEAAHTIAQEDESQLGSWAHAIVHLQEGDLPNASYWFRRAGRSPTGASEIESEIAALARALDR